MSPSILVNAGGHPSDEPVVWNDRVDGLLTGLIILGIAVYVIAALWSFACPDRDYFDLDLVRPIMRLFFYDSIINGAVLLVSWGYFYWASRNVSLLAIGMLPGLLLYGVSSLRFFYNFMTHARPTVTVGDIPVFWLLLPINLLMFIIVIEDVSKKQLQVPKSVRLAFKAHAFMAAGGLVLSLLLIRKLNLVQF